MLREFRNFDPEKGDVDEMVELSAFGRVLRSEYVDREMEIPSWLDAKQAEVHAELKRRQTDTEAKRLREIDRDLAALKSRDERKADLLAERERLASKQVGKPQA